MCAQAYSGRPLNEISLITRAHAPSAPFPPTAQATTADTFVNAGLLDAGYEFINTDDCWSNLARDNATGQSPPSCPFEASQLNCW